MADVEKKSEDDANQKIMDFLKQQEEAQIKAAKQLKAIQSVSENRDEDEDSHIKLIQDAHSNYQKYIHRYDTIF